MGGGALGHEQPDAYVEDESKSFELQLRFWLVVFSQTVLGNSFTQNDCSGEAKENVLHLMSCDTQSPVTAPVFLSQCVTHCLL